MSTFIISDHNILRAVKKGQIKDGERLPSCRDLAERLSMNKITVNKAYIELENEHLVFSVRRGGFYWIQKDETSVSASGRIIDFTSVQPESRLIPLREFTHVINQAADYYKKNLFGYGSTAGLPALQEELVEKFRNDGIYTKEENIIVTNGAQQAINLILQTVFRNSEKQLLVEEPTYNLVLRIAEFYKIDCISITRTVEGYDLKKLSDMFKSGEIAAFYLMPRHHNPTGYKLSEVVKKQLVNLAAKYEVLLIEDDYLADLADKRSSLPLHYYDINKQSIYIRSFSKTFMPGLRIGAAVIPHRIMSEVMKLKYLFDLNTSKLLQAALKIYLSSGMYMRHVVRIKKLYETKLKKAREVFHKMGSDNIIWHVPDDGIFIWLELRDGIDGKRLKKILENQGILLDSAEEYFLSEESKAKGGRAENCFRLCIAGVATEKVKHLSNVIAAVDVLAAGNK